MNATDQATFESWKPGSDLLTWGTSQDSLSSAYTNCANPKWLLWLLKNSGVATSDDWINICTDVATIVLSIYQAACPSDTKPSKALTDTKSYTSDKTTKNAATSSAYASGASANAAAGTSAYLSAKAIAYAADVVSRTQWASYEDAARVSDATIAADTAGKATDYSSQVTAIRKIIKDPFAKTTSK
jgi:hypothetical protein